MNVPRKELVAEAEAQLAPQVLELPALVDHGHLRLPAGRIPDHDGHFGRPDRVQTTTPDRASAFGAPSVLAAFSGIAEMLSITRAVLGVAVATLAPSTLSLIRNMFRDPDQRAFAIGPLAGGLLLALFWRVLCSC